MMKLFVRNIYEYDTTVHLEEDDENDEKIDLLVIGKVKMRRGRRMRRNQCL